MLLLEIQVRDIDFNVSDHYMIMNPLHTIIIITTNSEINNCNYNLYTLLTSSLCSSNVKEVTVDIVRIYQQQNTLHTQENIYSL